MKISQRIPKSTRALLLAAGLMAGATGARAQARQPLPDAPAPLLRGPGGVVIESATPGGLTLTLDEAIDRATAHNAQLKVDEQTIRLVQGQIGTAFNALLPSLTASARTATQEIDLAALGFKPSSLAALGFSPSLVPLIVKVNTTAAQLNVSQTFFNVPAYEVYRAAQHQVKAADMNMRLTRGNVVMDAGAEYLRAVADQAQIDNNEALLKQDEEQLRQEKARDEAGVSTRLDVIRAQVQLQTQQQAVISAVNTHDKDIIALNRTLGLPAGQQLKLVDAIPYAAVPSVSLDDAMTLAYGHRKDYLNLLAQQEVARREREAVKWERLPTLGFNGFYGVLGETHGLYHGNFVAEGTMNFPIFREAEFRAEREATDATLDRLRRQIASLSTDMEQQIRAAQLDVQSAADLVKVASSNVGLAKQQLSDAIDRRSAGVDDNLRVVEAQATLAQAEATLVEDQYQFNYDKLALARATGVVETQFKDYLGQ